MRKLLEHRGQRTGYFRRGHHIDIQIAENIGIFAQRAGKTLSAFNIVFDGQI